jgi:anti-sigma-K factor RskA
MTGAGRVLVDAASGDAAIVLSGLAPIEEGKAYELWAIRGKKAPEPAGMVAVSDEHGGALRVPSVPRPSEVTAFAVSIEPRGGSTSPTGPIVLVGAVAS